MKIAIIGYGRMGKTVENIALQRGHSTPCIIDKQEDWQTRQEELKNCDVAIDFSMADVVVQNIERCHNMNIPVVTGTTGWDEQRLKMIEPVKNSGHTLFYAPNFSIGVNLLFELNRRLSQLIQGHTQYSGKIDETHHIHKVDAPSGTAITLANDIIKNHKAYSRWTKEQSQNNSDLPVHSQRIDEVIGDHKVTWDSDVDTLSIEHHAKNRNGFGLGAIIAAEWVKDKKGYYEMTDMLFA
ncbi:MAG: 4-hydroxy-tetrahydrodipicolinate reductase [Bacteroidales bacterium]